MGNKLEGKVAVITGGGSGIGLATAKRFVSEGAYVFIIDLHKKELDSALSEIGSKNVVGIEGDVSNIGDLDKLYNAVKDQKRPARYSIRKCGYYTICPIGRNFRTALLQFN